VVIAIEDGEIDGMDEFTAAGGVSSNGGSERTIVAGRITRHPTHSGSSAAR
jgi:hypothetical protein